MRKVKIAIIIYLFVLPSRMPTPLQSPDIYTFRQNMFRDIRMELDQLKNCQSNAIIWGVGASTTIISILNLNNQGVSEYPFLLLIPLLVIFPSWLIFFDKSRTISRLTGFLRIQEKLAAIDSKESVIGWETALELFWKKQPYFSTTAAFLNAAKAARANYPKNRTRKLSQIYWSTVYMVFFGLSVLSLFFCYIYIKTSTLNSNSNNLLLFVEIALLFCSVLLCIDLIEKIFKKKILDIWNYNFGKFLTFMIIYVAIFYLIQFVCLINTAKDLSLTLLDQRIFFNIILNDGLFILFLGLFVFVSFVTGYIFSNLTNGRYTTAVYESRWSVILNVKSDLNKEVENALV